VTGAAIAVALLSAVLFAVGSVLQQRAASEVPDEDSLGLGLVTRLVRRPIWLAGTAGDTLGYVAQAAALGLGSLALVQPLLATSLLFALPLGAWWAHRRLSRSDGLWAVVLTAGLAVFLVAGEPTEGVDRADVESWLVAAAVILPATGACMLVAARSRGGVRSVALASATGILYGVAAALTKSTVSLLDDGLVGILTSWEPYALVAAAALGTYLQQSSYQAGDLSQALPAAAVLEPVVAVGLGIAILQEDIRSSGPEWILIGLSVVAMIAATASLARSQAAAEPAGAASPAPAPDAA
jgi:drug/metabolite transporter (DMT)-like permease